MPDAVFVVAVLIALALIVRVPARLRGELQVDTSPEETFAFVADPRNTPHWNPRVHAVQPETNEPVRKGYRYRYEVRGAGRVVPCTAEIIEFDPGRALKVKAHLGERLTNVFGYSVEPTATGTLLRGFADARVSLYHALVIQIIGSRRLGANLQRIKAALEQTSGRSDQPRLHDEPDSVRANDGVGLA